MVDVPITVRGGEPNRVSRAATLVSAGSHAATAPGDYVLAIVDFPWVNPANVGIRPSAGVDGWVEVGRSQGYPFGIIGWLGRVNASGSLPVSVTISQNDYGETMNLHVYTLDAQGGTITADGLSTMGGTSNGPYTHGSLNVAGTRDLLVAAHGAIASSATYNGGPAGMTPATTLGDATSGHDAVMQTAFEQLSSGGSTGTRRHSLNVSGMVGHRGWMLALRSQGEDSATAKTGGDTGTGSDSGTVTARPTGGDTGTGTETGGSVSATIVGSDSGVGAESGFVAVPRAGGDTGSGSETGYVASGYTGGDSASGAESGSLGASTGGADTATGTETGDIAATLDGDGDTATGTETGLIQLPGSDTAIGAETGDVDATAAGDDHAHGSEGGYVETLFGDLDVSLWAVDFATGELHPLPDFLDFEMTPTRNGPGTVSLKYPKDPDLGRNSDRIGAAIMAGRDLQIEIWTIGSALGARRAYLQEAGRDDVADETADDHLWSLAGQFLETRMSEARVYPQPKVGVDDLGDEVAVPLGSVTEAQWQQLLDLGYTGREGDDAEQIYAPSKVVDAVKAGDPVPVLADPKRELVISAATPGEVMNLLLAQARARGALTDVVTSFTGERDSAGTLWTQRMSAKVSPGSTYESVLNLMASMGRAEWSVSWNGTAPCLNIWRQEGRGVDHTIGLRPVILRAGRNLAEAPRKWSIRSSPTAMGAAGAEGVYAETRDLNAEARRGRRIEGWTSSQNLTTGDAVLAYAQRRLGSEKDPTLEVTHGLALLPGEPRPILAFDVGDWVYSTVATENERYRVVEWSLRVDAEREMTAAVTLNDAFVDELVRQRQLLDAIASGEAVVGTSQPGEDTGVPTAPTGLVVGSMAFLEGRDVYASVQAGWNPVEINLDGSATTDLDSYRVEWALESEPEAWNLGADVPAQRTQASFTVAPATPIRVRVQARDRSGNRSPWSDEVPHLTEDDATPPPVASAPTVTEFIGTLRITWDGLTADGADMAAAAADFSHVELHLSPGSNFPPDSETLVTQLYARGTWTIADLPIGVTQFARFVAVDTRGNRSEPSDQGSTAPRQLLGPEIFEGAVGSAALADLAVLRANIADLAVNDAKIADLDVGKVTTGTLQADVTLSGIIRTDTTGARTEIDNAGLRLYGTSNDLRVNLRSADGSALVTGEYRTAMSGARMVYNPGGSSPAESRWYPAQTNQYARIKPSTSVAIGYEGQGGINMKSYSPRADQQSGEVNVYPGLASLVWGDEDGNGRITSRIAASDVLAFVGGPRVRLSASIGQYYGIQFSLTRSDGRTVGQSSLILNDEGPNGLARLISDSPNGNSGIQFNDFASKYHGISVINGTDGVLVGLHCGSVRETSDRRFKTDIESDPLDATAAVRRAQLYRYRHNGVIAADTGPRLGLMADELPDELVSGDDHHTVDLYGTTAVLWGAVREVLDRLDRLEAT